MDWEIANHSAPLELILGCGRGQWSCGLGWVHDYIWHNLIFGGWYRTTEKRWAPSTTQSFNIFCKLTFHFWITVNLYIAKPHLSSKICFCLGWSPMACKVKSGKMSYNIQSPERVCLIKIKMTCQYSFVDNSHKASLTGSFFYDPCFSISLHIVVSDKCLLGKCHYALMSVTVKMD